MKRTDLALIGLALLAGCGGGGGDSPRPPAPVTMTSLTVFPSSQTLKVGETKQYTVTVKDSNGNIRQNVTVDWSTGDAAIASIDANGLLTARNEGSTTVHATSGSVQSQLVTVTVSPLVVPPPPPSPPPPPPHALLPPWITYCDNAACESLFKVVAAACPQGNTGCTPTRSTIVSPRANGLPISAVEFQVNGPPGITTRLISGDGLAIANFLAAYATPSIQLKSDLDGTLSFYHVAPVWGGTSILDFDSTMFDSPLLTTVYYHHPSYAVGSGANLHDKAQQIIRIERDMTGIIPADKITAFFLPTELVANPFHEGNVSFGNGTVTINWGNPPYVEATGGIAHESLARFSHEHAHELFDEITGQFPDNFACLNEGIADATGWLSGFLPVEEFGPFGVKGLFFEDGCQTQQDVHDVGNCPLWHVKMAGKLTPAFLHGLFHPQHVFVFDSCVLNQETGDNLWVYYTESAGGVDMVAVLDSAKIPHSATFADAKKAIGVK